LPKGGASWPIKKDALPSSHKLSPKESEESKLPKVESRIIKRIPNILGNGKSPNNDKSPQQKSSDPLKKSKVCLCKKTVVLAKQSLMKKKPPGDTFSLPLLLLKVFQKARSFKKNQNSV